MKIYSYKEVASHAKKNGKCGNHTWYICIRTLKFAREAVDEFYCCCSTIRYSEGYRICVEEAIIDPDCKNDLEKKRYMKHLLFLSIRGDKN